MSEVGDVLVPDLVLLMFLAVDQSEVLEKDDSLGEIRKRPVVGAKLKELENDE